eukprot:354526-Chlamydomonas_euryale.AAC.6
MEAESRQLNQASLWGETHAHVSSACLAVCAAATDEAPELHMRFVGVSSNVSAPLSVPSCTAGSITAARQADRRGARVQGAS